MKKQIKNLCGVSGLLLIVLACKYGLNGLAVAPALALCCYSAVATIKEHTQQ